jgi:hypothetical protein
MYTIFYKKVWDIQDKSAFAFVDHSRKGEKADFPLGTFGLLFEKAKRSKRTGRENRLN